MIKKNKIYWWFYHIFHQTLYKVLMKYIENITINEINSWKN